MKIKEKKLLIILIIVLTFIDQFVKVIFISTKAKIGNIDNFSLGILNIDKSENNIQYILVIIIAIIALIRYISSNNSYINNCNKLIISFAISGCISMLIDRIWNRGVINYINISKTLSINLGYIYIIITWIGMAVLLTKHTINRINENKEKERKKG